MGPAALDFIPVCAARRSWQRMESSFSGQKRARGTTCNDGRGPPSAVLSTLRNAIEDGLRRTGTLSASCDRTAQTPNCECAQTGVEQRITAVAFLTEIALILAGKWRRLGRDCWGAGGAGRPGATLAPRTTEVGKRRVPALQARRWGSGREDAARKSGNSGCASLNCFVRESFG